MYACGGKKMLNMMILEILRKHSDEEHLRYYMRPPFGAQQC